MSEIAPNIGGGWAHQEIQIPEAQEVDLSAMEIHGFIPFDQAVDAHALLVQIDQEQHIGYGRRFGFRYNSISKVGADEAVMDIVDRATYAEVAPTLGFDGYYPGIREELERKCSSTCIWKSHEIAYQTLKKSPMHALAVKLAPFFYEVGVIEYVNLDYTPVGTTVSYIKPPHELNLNPTEQSVHSDSV